MAGKKRQHFVPKFLLRRFAARDGRWQGHVFRLPVSGGGPKPAVPKTEAAQNRYYDLPEELVGEVQPELILEKIESGAAAAISRLEQHQHLRDADLVWLAYFASLQTNRTPADRAEARYLDEVMATQMEELRFSAKDQQSHSCDGVIRRSLRKARTLNGGGLSETSTQDESDLSPRPNARLRACSWR